MSGTVVKVSEVVGCLYDEGDGHTMIRVDEGEPIDVDSLFPDEASVEWTGTAWKGKRGRFVVTVEFTPDP